MSIGVARRLVQGSYEAEPVVSRVPRPGFARRVPRQAMEELARAQRVVAEAEREAHALMEVARAEAAHARLAVEAEARAEAVAKLAGEALALKALEFKQLERQLDDVVKLARVLAERLLGEELTTNPERIASMAREAIREARGARQVVIVAHPADCTILERSLAVLGMPEDSIRFLPEPSRARGQLRLDTDVGVLDAELSPQLERLALRLRETLASRLKS